MEEVKFNKADMHVLLTVCLSMFIIPLTITSSSVLNLSIMKEYSLTYQEAQWFINIFMVMYGALLPITGSLSDYVGRKNIFLFGLVSFSLGFLLGGIIENYTAILFFRATCGIAAAAVTTSATSLLTSHIDATKRPKAFSIFGVFLGLGMIAGPLLASGLNYISWGWALFSTIMFLILFLLLISLIYIKDNTKYVHSKFDWFGGIVLTLFLLSTVSLISFLPIWSIYDRRTVFLILTSLVCAISLYQIEKIVENPIIDLTIFKNRIFSSMSITTLLLGFGYISIVFYFPYYLKITTDFTSFQVGVIMTIATLPSFVFPPLIAKFRNSFGDGSLLKMTLALLIISPLYLNFVIGGKDILQYCSSMFLLGSSFGISLSYLDGVAVSSVETHKSGLAAGTFNTFRIGGESISIPLVSTVISFLNNKMPERNTSHGIISNHFINNVGSKLTASTSITLLVISAICLIFSTLVLNLYYAKKSEPGI
ncbi:MFS transporter [Xenorhabdus sp. DI]|uniref:MFS transporter n=1 Tax=Xenorhabdus doucetiae TaxID=351671 RepID=UPI0019917CF5|nr:MULTISPECIES: MFS transporter [unclassified Xenorhabdus]MBD2784460.1 MFS transporter [Xenorhabdus sp. 3]MBD2789280.1 MFS transporter [Xenorhabdus sp. DI]